MGRTACTEPQCLYKGDLYLYIDLVCGSEQKRTTAVSVTVLYTFVETVRDFVSVCRY